MKKHPSLSKTREIVHDGNQATQEKQQTQRRKDKTIQSQTSKSDASQYVPKDHLGEKCKKSLPF